MTAPYSFPCAHTIRLDETIDLRTIHYHWQRVYAVASQMRNEIIITTSGGNQIQKNTHNL